MTWRTPEKCRSLLEYSHDPHETQTGTFTEDFPDLGSVDLRDEADELFLIISGSAGISAGDTDIAQRGPGDPVGELAILSRSVRTADVVARGDVRVLVVQADAFEAILADRPTVARAMLSVVATRLAETDALISSS